MKNLTEKEKLEYAKNWREVSFQKGIISEKRVYELADEFTKLEVQIAAILFAFTSFFADKFNSIFPNFSYSAILILKILFLTAIMMLILSLALGLLHLKRKEKFWSDFFEIRDSRHRKWDESVRKEITVEEARAFHIGAAYGRGNIISSPTWTWVLQTVALGIAVILICILLTTFLFR